MQESSKRIELPRFQERLSELSARLRAAASALGSLAPDASYLPAWEELHTHVHSLKGVTRLLAAAPVEEKAVQELNETMKAALTGDQIVLDGTLAAGALESMAQQLEAGPVASQPWEEAVARLKKSLAEDQEHDHRISAAPPDLHYVDALVSKRAREAGRLVYKWLRAEERMKLEEIPAWREKLLAAMQAAPPSLLVSFLPFVQSEGSTDVRINAWIAAKHGPKTRASIQRLLPHAKIT